MPTIGIPDEQFSAEPPGMITRREVRLIALAYLELHGGEVFWDIGTGSGSVAIEAVRLVPALRAFAIEKSPAALAQARANAEKFSASSIALVGEQAPAALHSLPAPHAVFIGGSGGNLASILEVVARRLLPAGRLVLNCITLENLTLAWEWLTRNNWQVSATQVQLARSEALGRFNAFEPDRPVFIIQARRK